MFDSVAYSRRNGSDLRYARIQLSSAVILANGDLAERLANAPDPFWCHVRDALGAL